MLKKTLALFLALLLCVSGSVMAFAASDNANVIMGEVDIINPTFVVSVPLNLNFSLDPLKIKGQSQIFSGDTSYNIVNKATVPVKVDFALKITTSATSGVTFQADASSLNKALPSSSNTIDKDLYVAIQGAQSIDTSKTYDSATGKTTTLTGTTKNLTSTTSSGNVVPIYSTATPAITTNLVDFETNGAQEASGIFSFLVNAGVADSTAPTDVTKNKPTANSMTSFRLYGDLNTYAAWDAADFKFEGSYDFMGVAQDDYDAAIIDDTFMLATADAPTIVKDAAAYGTGLAQPLVLPGVEAGFLNAAMDDTTTTLVIDCKVGKVDVPFYFDGKTMESFKFAANGTEFAFAAGANKFTVSMGTVGAGKAFNVKLKNDDTVYKVTFNVT